MSEIDLGEKFPDMRPIKRPPGLTTINGIGLTMAGSRDYDDETNTYVKTHCFSVLFIPLFAVGAYRVADAPGGGWYFLGKVPLSGFARFGNLLVVLAVACGIGLVAWFQYTGSADYRAGQRLAQGDELAGAGKVVPAAQVYREVALGKSGRTAEAMARLKDLTGAPLDKASPADAAAVLNIAAGLKDQPGAPAGLYERGLQLVEKHAARDPKGALAVADAVAPLAPKPADLAATRQKLLERIVAREPQNVDMVSELAVIYEEQRQPAKCEKLLVPLEEKLKADEKNRTSEAARILAQIYARKGKLDQAQALLVPYAEGRLEHLHQAEEAMQRAARQVVDKFRSGPLPADLEVRLKGAPKERQEAIFRQYVLAELERDPAYREARDASRHERRVVPVALELGQGLLLRARKRTDPKARERELKKAEKTLLAVRGVAGDSDFYRLNLGQVYYWMGKHGEGRKLFDKVLESRQRNGEALLRVSVILRELGAFSESRALAEEAYNKETDRARKQDEALQRALVPLDLDDEITWLRRADPDSPPVQALLSMDLGRKALQEGKEEAAAEHVRQAIAVYRRQPENSATLNNMAVGYGFLYQVTGDAGALAKQRQMQEKALALLPGDSILVSNTAGILQREALKDVMGGAIDLGALRLEADLSLFRFLYRDQAGREPYVRKVRESPGIAKARSYYERVLLLAPKRPRGYTALAALDQYTDDLGALKALRERLEGVDLDLADAAREARDLYAGKRDQKEREQMEAAVRNLERALRRVDREPRGVTFAVAASSLAAAEMARGLAGGSVDIEEVVRLAEKAHAAAPSKGTSSALASALLARADRRLAGKEPAYAALITRPKRSLPPLTLIAVALAKEGALRRAVLADPDVKRAVGLVKEVRKHFPGEADEWAWAVLRAADPEAAREAAEAIRKDEVAAVKRDIDLKLQPFDVATAYRAAWALEAAGKEDKARDVLKALAARGVPLPAGVK